MASGNSRCTLNTVIKSYNEKFSYLYFLLNILHQLHCCLNYYWFMSSCFGHIYCNLELQVLIFQLPHNCNRSVPHTATRRAKLWAAAAGLCRELCSIKEKPAPVLHSCLSPAEGNWHLTCTQMTLPAEAPCSCCWYRSITPKIIYTRKKTLLRAGDDTSPLWPLREIIKN